MNILNLKELLKTRIRVRCFDSNGVQVAERVMENTPTLAFADTMMTALLRSGSSQITHLYARFGDSGANPGYLAPSGGDLENTVRSDFLYSPGGDTVRGGLWVPLLSSPVQTSSDETVYVKNQGIFLFRIPATISADSISPSANFDVSTSWIYGLGLAVAQDTSDREQDQIVTAMHAFGYDLGSPSLGNFSKFQIPAGGQVSVDYTMAFQVTP